MKSIPKEEILRVPDHSQACSRQDATYKIPRSARLEGCELFAAKVVGKYHDSHCLSKFPPTQTHATLNGQQ